ncbi:Bug family tripartite tricarboxylate transporter substrate binding protein [Pseudorhodoplanes sp.]|uniref:Bug family tripartite tricarboxylate transporter substrate binding protein n=1 Tax=Pseudorhodoplanes sp. TaxID=1934341 RepID=UPI00391A7D61
MKSRRIVLMGAASLGLAWAMPAFGQTYPNRPIKWMVGYPAGGASDFLARVLATKMGPDLAQPLVIENKPGAAGIISMDATAKSDPDGYTIANTGNGEFVFNLGLYKKLPYDADKDFALVGTIAKVPMVLIVQPSMPVKNLKELISLAKKDPGKLNYGSGGIGHPVQMGMEMLKHRAGIDLTPVAYRGMAPAVQDFLAGSTSLMFVDLAAGLGIIRDGKARPIAVSTRERLPALPDVPTIEESGIPDFDVFAWQGMIVPAKTPTASVERLRKSLNTALQDAEIVKRFNEAGMQPMISTPAEFATLIQNDRKLWLPLIKSLNLSLE